MKKHISILILLGLLALIGAPACAQAEQRRLLVIGDSFAKGLYASSVERGYKFILADRLNMQLGWILARTLDEAETGWAAWDWPADIIILEIGSNDLWTGVPEAEWPGRYGALLDSLQASGARVIVGNVAWSGRDPGTTAWEHAQRYNEYIQAEANARGILVADLWGATLNCTECLSNPGEPSPFDPGFEGDNFHPGDYGHQIIANEFLRQVLNNRYYLPIWSMRYGVEDR